VQLEYTRQRLCSAAGRAWGAAHGVVVVQLLDGGVGQAVEAAIGLVHGLAALAQARRARHPLDDTAVLRQRHYHEPARAPQPRRASATVPGTLCGRLQLSN